MEVVEILTVERHDGDALEITLQELIVGLDVDLLERHADPLEHDAGVVT